MAAWPLGAAKFPNIFRARTISCAVPHLRPAMRSSYHLSPKLQLSNHAERLLCTCAMPHEVSAQEFIVLFAVYGSKMRGGCSHELFPIYDL
jgi:hypothetical protein